MFVKGNKHGKGRPAGSKNRKQDLFAICDAKGINLFEEQLTAAMMEKDPDKRFSKFSELLPYVYAKKREVLNLEDHTPEELIETAEKLIDGSKEAS